MLAILVSSILSLITFLLCWKIFSVIAAILPAIIVFLVSFIIISRKINKELQILMADVTKELQKQNIEKALSILKKIKQKYRYWQIFLASSIDGQIGIIFYMKNKYKEAKPFLEKAFVQNWVARAMLAIIYYRERNFSKMEKIFSHATQYNKKSGLLWGVWAYCLWRNGEIEKAIKILSQGKRHLHDNDPILSSNLLLLQNQKKMKMKGYHEQWYQFQLEMPPSMVEMQKGRLRFQNR